jgi:hypothetical protein
VSILLVLLAFPGLGVLAMVLWQRAARRYQSHMRQVASYPDPTIYDVIEQGILGTYRRASTAASKMDVVAGSGSLGPEARRLQAIERRWFFLVGLSIPVGMGLGVIVSWALKGLANATDTPTDALAIVIVVVSSFSVVGMLSVRSALALARSPETRTTAWVYVVGLVVLALGAIFVVLLLLG